MITDIQFGTVLHDFFEFCIQKHWNQKQLRKGLPIPYYFHLSDVFKLLSTKYQVNDLNTLLGSLGHDLLEDTDTTEDEILEKSNETVLKIIKGCTRPNGDKVTRKDKLDFMKKISDSEYDILIIKFADRICNIKDYYNSGQYKYAAFYALQAYPIYQSIEKNIHPLGKCLCIEGKDYYKNITEDVDFIHQYIINDNIKKEILESYYNENFDIVDQFLIDNQKEIKTTYKTDEL